MYHYTYILPNDLYSRYQHAMSILHTVHYTVVCSRDGDYRGFGGTRPPTFRPLTTLPLVWTPLGTPPPDPRPPTTQKKSPPVVCSAESYLITHCKLLRAAFYGTEVCNYC